MSQLTLALARQTEIPPEIPEHVSWSEKNARRRLYNLYRERLHEWIPLKPDIAAITKTKHTQRNSNIREQVLTGTEWIIDNRTERERDEAGELVIGSWYRLTTRQRIEAGL